MQIPGGTMNKIKKTIKYTAALMRLTIGISAAALVVLSLFKKPK